MLESLPDELLLLIFRYLHKFDVLYAFTNLNSRFQQIIALFLSHVNFTRQQKPSYKKFQWLCDNIIPLQGHNVRSLKLEECHQLLALRTHVGGRHEAGSSQPVIHQLTHLQSLTLKMEGSYAIHHEDEVNQFLSEVLKISSLTELSVSLPGADDLLGIHADRVARILESIASSTSNKIANLTLIYPRSLLRLKSSCQILNIKCLSITLHFAATLIQLFNALPNLQELSLSIVMFDDTEPLKSIKSPERLEKLHLEGGTYDYRTFQHQQPSFEMIKVLLDIFKFQLQSLTLIVNNADKNFANFNKFQGLVCNFTCLRTFEYCIRTSYRPDSLFPNITQLTDLSFSIFTIPRPRQFDTTSLRITYAAEFNSDLSMQELFNCQLIGLDSENCDSSVLGAFKKGNEAKLVNLKKLSLTCRNKPLSAGFCRLLLKLMALSPGLTDLLISSGTNNANNLIKQLQKVVPRKEAKQFTRFELFAEMNSKKWEFSFELSEMFPNLKTISIQGEQRSVDNCFSSLREFVQDLQTHFKELARLTIKTYASNRRAFECYENDLRQLSKQTTNPIYYTAKDQGAANYFLDIWL